MLELNFVYIVATLGMLAGIVLAGDKKDIRWLLLLPAGMFLLFASQFN